MKKIIFVFAVLFIANLGCKKMSDTDTLCACSPVMKPFVSLVIKNSADLDLLNPSSNGGYKEKQIQLYLKDSNGNNKQVSFRINPSFTYGNEKFNYYQLTSIEIIDLAKSIDDTFYLKLGDNQPIEINLQVKNQAKVEKLIVDKKEILAETGNEAKYFLSLFYLTL
jgi:hypothetical protein